jgi:hypothetical protein
MTTYRKVELKLEKEAELKAAAEARENAIVQENTSDEVAVTDTTEE